MAWLMPWTKLAVAQLNNSVWSFLLEMECILFSPLSVYLLRRYEPEQSPVEVDLLLQLLWREEGAFPRTTAGLQCWERHVEDRPLYVGVVLDVKHKHLLAFGGQHRSDTLHEEAEQRRQEALLGHVLQTHCDAVGQHVICDDGYTQCTQGHDCMETVWKEKNRRFLTFCTHIHWQITTPYS